MRKTPEEWSREIAESNDRLLEAADKAVKTYAEASRKWRKALLLAYAALAINCAWVALILWRVFG